MKPKRRNERKKVLKLYVAFFGTLVLSCATPPKIAALSLMACVLVLSVIYSLRLNAEENSLMENHATYLIRTFWRANLYMAYSFVFAAVFLILFTDYAALKPCVYFVTQYWDSIITSWGADKYAHLFEACGKTLKRANHVVLLAAGVILLLPSICFIIHRFYVGWRHAVRGLRLSEKRL